MTDPTAFGVTDAPNPWVTCPSCKGEAWVTTCLAETCPHHPPCPKRRCSFCAGNGGWYRSEAAG